MTEEPWEAAPDRSLNSDGTLDVRPARPDACSAPGPSPDAGPGGEIELAARPLPPSSALSEADGAEGSEGAHDEGDATGTRPPPGARPGTKVALALMATLLLAGAGAWHLTKGRRLQPDSVRSTTAVDVLLAVASGPPMVIMSEPSGAVVRVSGREVGVTPWAGENSSIGSIEVELSAPGYAPYRRRYEGRTEVHLEARLRRR
jgi:hypothetical protein